MLQDDGSVAFPLAVRADLDLDLLFLPSVLKKHGQSRAASNEDKDEAEHMENGSFVFIFFQLGGTEAQSGIGCYESPVTNEKVTFTPMQAQLWSLAESKLDTLLKQLEKTLPDRKKRSRALFLSNARHPKRSSAAGKRCAGT